MKYFLLCLFLSICGLAMASDPNMTPELVPCFPVGPGIVPMPEECYQTAGTGPLIPTTDEDLWTIWGDAVACYISDGDETICDGMQVDWKPYGGAGGSW